MSSKHYLLQRDRQQSLIGSGIFRNDGGNSRQDTGNLRHIAIQAILRYICV